MSHCSTVNEGQSTEEGRKGGKGENRSEGENGKYPAQYVRSAY